MARRWSKPAAPAAPAPLGEVQKRELDVIREALPRAAAAAALHPTDAAYQIALQALVDREKAILRMGQEDQLCLRLG